MKAFEAACTGFRAGFVTDYDGTLLTDNRSIHPEDLETLAKMRAAQILVVIATGRSLFSFVRSLESMGLSLAALPVDYLVFSTGAGIMDLKDGRMIRALDLPFDRLSQCCSFFDAQGYDYMVHAPIPDTSRFLYKMHNGANLDFSARMDLYTDLGTPLECRAQLYDKATEVLAIVPRPKLGLSMDEIRSALPGASVVFATSPLDGQSVWIEVFHAEACKSKALEWLSGQLGLHPDQIASVGNDYNDLDLLKWSGMGMMVENGPEAFRDAFVRVGSNNCCGVSQAARAAGFLG